MNDCRVVRKGSGVVFGECVFHMVRCCPKTTPDPVATIQPNPTLIVLPVLRLAVLLVRLPHVDGGQHIGQTQQRADDADGCCTAQHQQAGDRRRGD